MAKVPQPVALVVSRDSLRAGAPTIVRNAVLVANHDAGFGFGAKGGRVSRLYLLRHAKAGWALPGMRDFDRPLDASGRADAETIGAAMRSRGYVPDRTLCSDARRARETLEGLAGQTDTGKVLFFDTLYSEDAAGYLRLIREHGGLGSLLVIGHNPMTEDLAMAVSGYGDETARAMLNHGFPTSALAVVRFPDDLAKATQKAGYLEAFLTPADL